ncbi:6840_t:CDS:1, partial [Funneliformis caledonium]
IKPKYQPIIDILNTVGEFELICIDEYLPVDFLKRPVFLKEMSLSSPTTLYIYYYGNYLDNLHWIWKKNEKINDNTKTLETQAILYNEIPKY